MKKYIILLTVITILVAISALIIILTNIPLENNNDEIINKGFIETIEFSDITTETILEINNDTTIITIFGIRCITENAIIKFRKECDGKTIPTLQRFSYWIENK